MVCRSIAILVGVLVLATTTPAQADCLSKREAREKWPRAHIYWHGATRCWDTLSHRRFRAQQRALALAKPSEPIKDEQEPPPKPKKSTKDQWAQKNPEILYPPLVVNRDKSVTFLQPTPMPDWKPLIDIDEDQPPAPNLDANIDGCCWPPLNSLIQPLKKGDKK